MRMLPLLVCGYVTTVLGQVVPTVRTSKVIVDVRDGDHYRKASWQMDPSVRPDVYETYMEGESKRVTFISEVDSISFNVEPGHTYRFAFLLNGKDSAFTEIKGIKIVPRARFDQAYQVAHRGRTLVEVPPVYELINIVFALTDNGMQDNGLINKDNAYYQEVMQWFQPYRQLPVVEQLNQQLAAGGDSYHSLKMDAYAFDLNTHSELRQSPVYDRIGRTNGNTLRNYIPALEQFSRESKFRDFFDAHQPYYHNLIRAYEDSVGVPEMLHWLTRNFPSTKYDSFKIIFSPLVANNQSASVFEYDGFREAQAHVNFPFRRHGDLQAWSERALSVKDGDIVFTELNHAFIGPEGEKPAYKQRIEKAFADLTQWNEPGKPAVNYSTPKASFDEYMNWGLVSIRYIDYAPAAEQAKLIARIDSMMVDVRGFRQFPAFNQFLVKAYKTRKSGQSVADLYPAIVGWFEGTR